MACHEDVTFRLIGIFPDNDFFCLAFLDLPLMKRAKRTPRIESFSGRKWIYVKEWSSGPQLCIQHINSHFMGTEQLAKPKFTTGCRLRVLSREKVPA